MRSVSVCIKLSSYFLFYVLPFAYVLLVGCKPHLTSRFSEVELDINPLIMIVSKPVRAYHSQILWDYYATIIEILLLDHL